MYELAWGSELYFWESLAKAVSLENAAAAALWDARRPVMLFVTCAAQTGGENETQRNGEGGGNDKNRVLRKDKVDQKEMKWFRRARKVGAFLRAVQKVRESEEMTRLWTDFGLCSLLAHPRGLEQIVYY